MAADEDPPTDVPACTACRATGKVISALGGEPKPVDCPWCEGTGVRQVGHDAQARWPRADSR